MPTIGDAEFRLTILKVFKLLGVDVGNCHSQDSVLVVYLEFIAQVDDASIFAMESRGAVFDCRDHVAEWFLSLGGWSNVRVAALQLCGFPEREPSFEMK